MRYTLEEVQEAKEEYLKIISSLQPLSSNLKGHWDDKEISNRFKKTIIEKGDKEYFTQYYFENKEIIKDAQNINIENIYDNEFE